jgi:hypothetical protein
MLPLRTSCPAPCLAACRMNCLSDRDGKCPSIADTTYWCPRIGTIVAPIRGVGGTTDSSCSDRLLRPMDPCLPQRGRWLIVLAFV